MKKSYVWAIAFSSVAVSVGCPSADGECIKGQYVQYRAVRLNPNSTSQENIYIVDNAEVKSSHRDAVIFVLAEWGRAPKMTEMLRYKMEGEVLLITCELWMNRSMMWDVTGHAEDETWIQARKEFHRKLDERAKSRP